jgi:hypothetical protein
VCRAWGRHAELLGRGLRGGATKGLLGDFYDFMAWCSVKWVLRSGGRQRRRSGGVWEA